MGAHCSSAETLNQNVQKLARRPKRPRTGLVLAVVLLFVLWCCSEEAPAGQRLNEHPSLPRLQNRKCGHLGKRRSTSATTDGDGFAPNRSASTPILRLEPEA